MSATITKSQLREHIAKLVAEQLQSLSPDAQKALEQSKVAKQNKDAQKKRAAAKDSMKGISVEAVDPIEEQVSSGRSDIDNFHAALQISSKTASGIDAVASKAKEQILSLVKGLEFNLGYIEDLKLGLMQPEGYVYGFDAIMSTGKTEPFEDLVFKSRRRLGEQSSWHRDQKGELSDLYKTKYRVNFGQGQVSNTFPTRKEAEYEMTFVDEPGAFIQFKDLDTGEWFNIKHLKEQRIEGDKLHSDEADFFDTDEFHDDDYIDDPMEWGSDLLGEPYDDFEDHVEIGYGEPDSGSYDLYDDMSDDDLDRRY